MPGQQLGIRVDAALIERADRLAKAIRGLNRGAVLRAAIEIGIETMEADPRFQQQPTGKKPEVTRRGGS